MNKTRPRKREPNIPVLCVVGPSNSGKTTLMESLIKATIRGVVGIALMMLTVGAVDAYEIIEVTDGGTITGAVKFIGTSPKIEPVPVNKNEDICGKTFVPRILEVNRINKGLKNTVVYLENIEKGRAPATKYSLHAGLHKKRPESVLCDFEEHILVTTREAQISFVNFDSVLHTPRAIAQKGREFFKVPLPNKGQVIKKKVKIKEPEVGMRVICDSHSHMFGQVVVLKHDYVALTDKNGKFTITDVPPGKYRLTAWHEGYNLLRIDDDKRPVYDEPQIITREIEVTANGEAKVDFEFAVRTAKKKKEG